MVPSVFHRRERVGLFRSSAVPLLLRIPPPPLEGLGLLLGGEPHALHVLGGEPEAVNERVVRLVELLLDGSAVVVDVRAEQAHGERADERSDHFRFSFCSS